MYELILSRDINEMMKTLRAKTGNYLPYKANSILFESRRIRRTMSVYMVKYAFLIRTFNCRS